MQSQNCHATTLIVQNAALAKDPLWEAWLCANKVLGCRCLSLECAIRTIRKVNPLILIIRGMVTVESRKDASKFWEQMEKVAPTIIFIAEVHAERTGDAKDDLIEYIMTEHVSDCRTVFVDTSGGNSTRVFLECLGKDVCESSTNIDMSIAHLMHDSPKLLKFNVCMRTKSYIEAEQRVQLLEHGNCFQLTWLSFRSKRAS